MVSDARQQWLLRLLIVGVEGGLAALAWGLGRLLSQPALEQFEWSFQGVAVGAGASLPLLGLFVLLMQSNRAPLLRIRQLLDEVLGALFGACSVLDLALISLLAGVGEEMLFRGVLQARLSTWLGLESGLAISSLVFGLLHAITPAYAMIATLFGLYLGGLLIATQNLLVPIVAHAVYDFLVLVYLLRRPQTPRGTLAPPSE